MATSSSNECFFDPEKKYYIADPECGRFTKLMALVLLINKNPGQIEAYLSRFPEELNVQNERGCTALMLACMYAEGETVRTLLTFAPLESSSMMCADPNIQDDRGDTALVLALIKGKREIVRMLLDFAPLESSKVMCVDLDIQNEYGWTALSLASSFGDEGMAKMLFDAGANPNIQNKNRCTALMCAVRSGSNGIVRMLS